jgi:hypothetical protein
MFPNAQALGAKHVFSSMAPVMPATQRPAIREIKGPTLLAMMNGSEGRDAAGETAATATPAPTAARQPGIFAKLVKSLLIGQTNGKFSMAKTLAKVTGLGFIYAAGRFMAENELDGLIGAVPSMLIAGSLFLLGRSKAPAAKADPKRTVFTERKIRTNIPANVRKALLAGYGGFALLGFFNHTLWLGLLATAGIHFALRKLAAKNLAAERRRAADEAARPLHEKIAQETSWVKLNELLVKLTEKSTPLPDDEILLNRMGTALHDKNDDLAEIERNGQLDADQTEARQNIASLLDMIDLKTGPQGS